MKRFNKRPKKLNLSQAYGNPKNDPLISSFADMNGLDYYPENSVIAFIGGYEMSVKEVEQLRDWCTKALDYAHQYVAQKSRVKIEGTPDEILRSP